jgi:hypothetical protein
LGSVVVRDLEGPSLWSEQPLGDKIHSMMIWRDIMV